MMVMIMKMMIIDTPVLNSYMIILIMMIDTPVLKSYMIMLMMIMIDTSH